MNFKKWIFPEIDKSAVSFVAEECGLDPLVVLIAFSRGLFEPYEIEQFASKEPEFSDPFDMMGITEAAERINIALESNEKILVFGDYDCDGVTATAVLVKFLKSKGADVIYKIPNRQTDGYGITEEAVRSANDDGVTLIITVDNGINAKSEVELANSLGIDVVVTDHHLPQGELPDAYSVVDPHIDGNYDWIFKDLCGAGVAFKLICAVDGRSPEEMIYEYADLVALGTIADVVPLRDENRIIVAIGLEMLNRRTNCGVKALTELSNIKYLTAGNVAFTLCPRINAAGRISSADTAVELLLSENYDNALYYAECLDRFNTERQNLESDIFQEACNIIEQKGYNHNRVIVVSGNNWHIGVIGIVASKIAEKYGKPTLVISNNGDRSVGSGRSIGEFSLFDALSSCSEILVKFGGHELAAGLTVSEENISILRNKINEYAATQPVCFATIKPDCKIKPRAFTVDAAKSLRVLEPYGVGNPMPLFAVMGSKIIGIQSLSNGKHLRLRLNKDKTDFNAVLFGVGPENFEYGIGDTVDIAVNIDVNVYNERETVSIIIKAIRMAGIDDAFLIEQLTLIDKIKSNSLAFDDVDKIYPSRNEIAVVFRYVQTVKSVKKFRLEHDLLGMLPLAKIYVAITALTELGIVLFDDGKYRLAEFAGKADLESAPILRKIKDVKEGRIDEN